MTAELRSRRDVLRGAAGLTVAIGGALACKAPVKPFVCQETTNLTPDEVATRKTIAYAEPSPSAPNPINEARACLSCQQYVAAAEAEAACGTCKLLKGPVHPAATCKLFAQKAT